MVSRSWYQSSCSLPEVTQPGRCAGAALSDHGAFMADVTDVTELFTKYTAEAWLARR